MITMGDELWRTQGGNNNAYCQDNEISWLDWPQSPAWRRRRRARPRDMLAFFRRTLAIRSEAPALRQGEFFDGRAPGGGDGIPDLVWFSPWRPADDRRRLVRRLPADPADVDRRPRRPRPHRRRRAADRRLAGCWCCTPATDPKTLVLPGPPYGNRYFPVLDTDSRTGAPADPAALPVEVPVVIPGRTVWLLRADRTRAALNGQAPPAHPAG